MYIISKKTDYYDSVGNQYGIDKSIVYKRTETEMPKGLPGSPGKISGNRIDRIDLHFPNGTKHEVIHEWYAIGFCGKLYVHLQRTVKGVVPAVTPYTSATDKVYHLYGDEIISVLEEADRNAPPQKKYRYSWRQPPNYRAVINRIREIEALDYSSVFFASKIPCFIIKIEGGKGNFYPVINPILADYSFYKVKDAFTAFQEIQQYISGVLGTDGNEPIVTDDKYKILAQGFDLKTSFRKDKEIKPRVKKK